jgi:peroxiredoxin Q/BCP
MKKPLLALALAALVATPALAALSEGAVAPDFSAKGYQAGKPISFHLDAALKKGPVVLYFFPAVHTGGCNAEAHDFAEAADQFKKEGATLIGVTAGNLDQLEIFSSETQYCSGKFPVAADPDLKIASAYDSKLVVRPGWSNRTSYVITPDHKVLLAYSAGNPDKHVEMTLNALKAWRASHPG